MKHKTSPVRLAQLLQPPLAFCFSLQPMTAYRPVASFILLAIAPLTRYVERYLTDFDQTFSKDGLNSDLPYL